MRIESITVSGFKNIKDEVTYNFGNKVNISGDNRSGKTTIGDLLPFLFFGSNMCGKYVSIDSIINKESSETNVQGIIIDDNGITHKINRIKNKRVQRVMFDDMELNAKERIEKTFGEMDLFLSQYNTRYFNEILDLDKRRGLIIKYSPIVDHVKLWEMFAPKELIDKYGIQINKKDEYKRFNKFHDDIQRQVDECLKEVQILKTENNIQSGNQIIQNIEEEKENTLKQQIDYLYNAEIENQKIIALAQQQELIKKEIEEIEKVIIQKNNELNNIGEFGDNILNFKDEYCLQLEKELSNFSYFSYPSFSDVSQIETCPTCFSQLDESKRKNIKEIQEKTIKEIEIKNKEIQAKFEETNNKLQIRKNELYEISFNNSKKLQQKVILETEIKNCISRIESLKSQTVDMSKYQIIDTSSLQGIKEEYSAVFSKNQEVRMQNSAIEAGKESINKRLERINWLENNVMQLDGQKRELSCICNALSPSKGVNRLAIEEKSKMLKNELELCEIIL